VGEIANVLAGGFFLFIGFLALSIAAIRPRRSTRLLLWLGIWSGMYGAQELLKLGPVVESLPVFLQAASPTLLVSFNFLIIVAGASVFVEMTLGTLHRLVQLQLVADVAVAVGGITLFVLSGSRGFFFVCNQVLVVTLLVTIVVTVSIPSLSRRFFVVSRHRVLTVGSLIFIALALWVNVAPFLDIRVPNILNSVAFAIFLLSIGYTGVEIMVADERRLLLLDDELAIARQLQFSILPERTPEVDGLEIAAIYKPMSAVAGDFYEFLVVDKRHVGVLIADVSGHGVPAALIASMIKVATQSVHGCPSDPTKVLATVGNILNKNVPGQLVSAAYLWMDMANGTATYSAAGHPPLVRWRARDQTFAHIESNGLLFGLKAVAEYPVCHLPLAAGDRFLLYTDGVTEPENQAGQPFGENRLEQLMRDNRSRRVAEISELLPPEIRAWQPPNTAQQDDITLVLVDVLQNVNFQPSRA
jgi:phosphoserine phosphatase RsbU/P